MEIYICKLNKINYLIKNKLSLLKINKINNYIIN